MLLYFNNLYYWILFLILEMLTMLKFNPAAEDFLSERNSYMIDPDDAAVATLGYSE